jgi:hypothetical protein
MAKRKSDFPRLEALTVSIRGHGVVASELRAKLGAEKAAEFHELFGVQTCPFVDGQPGLFAWDAEAVLERMASGKRTGTQLFWD